MILRLMDEQFTLYFNHDIIYKLKQDIYGFLVKNLDLDSNLYNIEKHIKKLVKY